MNRKYLTSILGGIILGLATVKCGPEQIDDYSGAEDHTCQEVGDIYSRCMDHIKEVGGIHFPKKGGHFPSSFWYITEGCESGFDQDCRDCLVTGPCYVFRNENGKVKFMTPYNYCTDQGICPKPDIEVSVYYE